MYLHDTSAQRRVLLHLADIIGKKQHLRITDIRNQREILALIAHNKAAVGNIILLNVTPCLQIRLPRRAERRIRKTKVKGLTAEAVIGDRGTEVNIVGLLAFALYQHVALCDGVGLVCNLLTVEMDGDLLAGFCRNLANSLVSHREHPACSACSVINAVGIVLNFVFHRNKGKVCDQLNDVSGREMASCIGDVGFLVKFTDNFLKNRAHGVVVQCRKDSTCGSGDRSGGEIDGLVSKFTDQQAKDIVVRELIDLVAEFKLFDDVLHILGKAVQIQNEVRAELLLIGA